MTKIPPRARALAVLFLRPLPLPAVGFPSQLCLKSSRHRPPALPPASTPPAPPTTHRSTPPRTNPPSRPPAVLLLRSTCLAWSRDPPGAGLISAGVCSEPVHSRCSF